MNPITYTSATVSNNVDGRGSSYRRTVISKQAKPYDQPAAYRRVQGYTTAASKWGGASYGGMANMATTKGPWQLAWGNNVKDKFTTELSSVLNQTYDRFRDAAVDTADMATNVAERQQSLDMIEGRARQLINLAVAIRRRDPRRIAQTLGISKKLLSPRLLAKSIGDIWLELHFGWVPMIQDIHNACDILQSPIADKAVRVRGKPYKISVHYSNLTATLSQEAYIEGSIRASCSAIVNVTNPNLYRANQLGLVNPASVAWELVPFSFVVDWFVPVSSFLNSFTDWVGIQLDRASYFYVIDTPSWTCSTKNRIGSNFPWIYGYDISSYGVHAERVLGIPSVTLVPRRWSGLSPTRAATAISLLLQQL